MKMVIPNNFEESDLSRAKAIGVDSLGLTILTNYSPKHKTKENNFKTTDVETPQSKSSFKFFFRRGTDMKFRLGFLKRRHTEGQMTPSFSSVRPSSEEATKWAESFQTLMSSKYGQSLFKAFLRREFSHENIEFWIAIEEYRKVRERKLNSKAQKIINEFVLSHSPREVNLDLPTKDSLISITTLSRPDYTTFDQAQKRIQGILEADAYVRFLQSDLYLELVHPNKYSISLPESKQSYSSQRLLKP